MSQTAVKTAGPKMDNTSGSGVYNASEKRYQFFWSLFFILVSIIAIIPILRVISISLSSKDAIIKGEVFIWPVGLNTDAYSKALKTGNFMGTMGYSVVLMLASAAINMVMTILMRGGICGWAASS